MYAYTSYKAWRTIGDPSEAMPGETVAEDLPIASPTEAFDDYCTGISNGVSGWLDGYVRAAFNYDSILSACTYAGDPDAKFAAEAAAAKQWRSDCFKALYAAIPSYATLMPDQWPALDYILAHLPQPSAYAWEPSA